MEAYIKKEKIENNYMLFIRLDTEQPYSTCHSNEFGGYCEVF